MPKQRRANQPRQKPRNSGREQLHSLVATAAPKDGWFRVVSHRGTALFSEYVGKDFNEAKKTAEKVATTGITCYIHNYHNRVVHIAR